MDFQRLIFAAVSGPKRPQAQDVLWIPVGIRQSSRWFFHVFLYYSGSHMDHNLGLRLIGSPTITLASTVILMVLHFH